MDLNEFKTNEKAEEEGVWEPVDDGCELLIARAGNKNWVKEWKKISKPYKKQIKRDTLSDEKGDKLVIECMAKTILLGWKGFLSDGKPLEYNYENCKKALAIKDFRDLVGELAQSMELYKIIDEEEDKENL